MTVTDKTYHTITEVAEMFGMNKSALRWWEREIPELQPLRTKGGQRLYRQSDVEMVRRIKELVYDRGLSIEAASAFLKDSAPFKRRPTCKSTADALKILDRLRTIVQHNLKAVTMIDIVKEYLGKDIM